MATANRPPANHPSDEMLLAYATGAASDAVSLIVASHLSYCPQCRARLGDMARLEAAFGAELAPVAPTLDAAAVLARAEAKAEAETPSAPIIHDASLPGPLARAAGVGIAGLKWRPRAPGVAEAPLPAFAGLGRANFVRLRAGAASPIHTHEGGELTIVLSGAYGDVTGSYARGDVAIADEGVEHAPRAAQDGDCVCFVVNDGPIRLTGPIGRRIDRLWRAFRGA